LEAQAAVAQAQRIAAESRLAVLKAEQNLLSAASKGATLQELTSLYEIVEKTKEQVAISDRLVAVEKNRQANLSAVQALEQSTLDYKQKTEKSTLDAQAAQLGLNTAVKDGVAPAQNIANSFDQMGANATQSSAEIRGSTAGISESYSSVIGAVDILNSSIDDTGVSAAGAASQVSTATSAITGALNGAGSSATGLEGKIDDVGNSIQATGSKTRDLNANLSAAPKDAYNEITNQLEAANTAVGGISADLGAAGSAAGGFSSKVSPIASNLSDASQASAGLSGNISKIPTSTLNNIETSFAGAAKSASLIASADVAGSVSGAQAPANSFANSMDEANNAVQGVSDKLKSLNGTTITVNVDVRGGLPGYWTGGPISGNTLARVNELGKEAFLSASGRLSMINRPANSTWRAPSSGTIIPAHLTSLLNIPRGGVSLPSGASSRFHKATRGSNGGRSLERAITSALRGSSGAASNGYEARSQAAQAAQLGRLTSAINELTRKNWNVDVKVRNTGNAAYLDALNQRL